LPEFLLLVLKPLFGLLKFINVGENHIPAKCMALGIAGREPTCAKPAVYAVGAAVTVDMFVRAPCLERVRPLRDDGIEIVRMNRVCFGQSFNSSRVFPMQSRTCWLANSSSPSAVCAVTRAAMPSIRRRRVSSLLCRACANSPSSVTSTPVPTSVGAPDGAAYHVCAGIASRLACSRASSESCIPSTASDGRGL
jgi:hypothetical protein